MAEGCSGYPREYRAYIAGCRTTGEAPLDAAAFDARWREFEDHAELLKAVAEGSGAVGAERRQDMERLMKTDPFVRAVLVGLAETGAVLEG